MSKSLIIHPQHLGRLKLAAHVRKQEKLVAAIRPKVNKLRKGYMARLILPDGSSYDNRDLFKTKAEATEAAQSWLNYVRTQTAADVVMCKSMRSEA
jgi:hypothetical protein